MTRSLSLVAALALAASLAACGESGSDDKGKSATTAAATISDATKNEAQGLLDQATAYIKDGKLDMADKAVTQLEGMKSKLTPEWQARVDQVRSALNAAKKAAGLKTGELPKVPEGAKLPG